MTLHYTFVFSVQHAEPLQDVVQTFQPSVPVVMSSKTVLNIHQTAKFRAMHLIVRPLSRMLC